MTVCGYSAASCGSLRLLILKDEEDCLVESEPDYKHSPISLYNKRYRARGEPFYGG